MFKYFLLSLSEPLEIVKINHKSCMIKDTKYYKNQQTNVIIHFTLRTSLIPIFKYISIAKASEYSAFKVLNLTWGQFKIFLKSESSLCNKFKIIFTIKNLLIFLLFI